MRRFHVPYEPPRRRPRLRLLALLVLLIALWCVQVAPEHSWLGFVARGRALCRNVEGLRRGVAELEVRAMLLQEQARERVRLKGLLAERDRLEAAGLRVVPARIVGLAADGPTYEVILDHGRRHRVRERDVVTCPSGLVGVVTQSWSAASRAILLPDRRVGVPVQLEPGPAGQTNDPSQTPHYGIVSGARDDGLLWLGYLFPDANIAASQEVRTSGKGEVYPPGLLVGRTTGSVILDPPPPRATVIPSVNWGQLREVLVVHRSLIQRQAQ